MAAEQDRDQHQARGTSGSSKSGPNARTKLVALAVVIVGFGLWKVFAPDEPRVPESPGERGMSAGATVKMSAASSDTTSKIGRPGTDDDATEVANALGAGPAGAKHIVVIAERYGVAARTVGDKAAKSTELCLGGTDQVGAQPTKAIELVKASLVFVEGVSRTPTEREMMPINEAFVAFVTMGCPT